VPLLLILALVLVSQQLKALLMEYYGFCLPVVLIIRNSNSVNLRELNLLHEENLFFQILLFKVLQVLINLKDLHWLNVTLLGQHFVDDLKDQH
jgi:hypothetical protein